MGFEDKPLAVLLAALAVTLWACVKYKLFTKPETAWFIASVVLLVYLFAPSGWLNSDRSVALIVSALTVSLLASGQYQHVERFSVAMVLLFMAATSYALYALQTTTGPLAAKAITGANIAEGLRFKLPENLGTAFAAFGMIGVGASELIYYPYWCLEKGYSRNIGPHEDSPGWYARAHGWLKIMRIDAWISMVIYTSATVVFFLLGAAMLQGTGVSDKTMIPDLSKMFSSLGPMGLKIFLVGAFMVLFRPRHGSGRPLHGSGQAAQTVRAKTGRTGKNLFDHKSLLGCLTTADNGVDRKRHMTAQTSTSPSNDQTRHCHRCIP
jgi:hypothetical protein